MERVLNSASLLARSTGTSALNGDFLFLSTSCENSTANLWSLSEQRGAEALYFSDPAAELHYEHVTGNYLLSKVLKRGLVHCCKLCGNILAPVFMS